MNRKIPFLKKTGWFLFQSVKYGCITFCVYKYLGWIIKLEGNSMMPTIHSKDRVVVENLSVQFRRLQKGDIVVAKSPFSPDQLICKRIVAMELDLVYLENGKRRKIPKGHFWLEGDNKTDSEDSRDYGPVPYGLIQSRVLFRWWPLHRVGALGFPHDEEEN